LSGLLATSQQHGLPAGLSELTLKATGPDRSHLSQHAEAKQFQTFELLCFQWQLFHWEGGEERASFRHHQQPAGSGASGGKCCRERARRHAEAGLDANSVSQAPSSFLHRLARAWNAIQVEPGATVQTDLDHWGYVIECGCDPLA